MKKIILALVLIEQFATIQEMCDSGTACEQCPFKDGLACTAVSTRRIVEVVGDAAREFLYMEGYYPLSEKQIEEEVKSWHFRKV